MNRRFDLHHVQKGIILSLAFKSPLRFTDLQPPRLPNNVFSYHLKKLIDTGYIERHNSGYKLTRKGLKLAAVNNEQRSRVTNPVVLTMLYVTNDNQEVLLINRSVEPFQGWYSLPSGGVHAGESLDESAERELVEKTGITAEGELTPAGVLDFQYREADTDDLFIHAFAFIYSYHYTGDHAIINDRSTKFGQLSWSQFGRQHILPEAIEVKKIVEGGVFTKTSIRFSEPPHSKILL